MDDTVNRSALITGITGQDGSYLAELLLSKGYKVFGTVRQSSTPNVERIAHILDRITLIVADMTDQASLDRAVAWSMPQEVYNLAAQPFVGLSWSQPVLTSDVTGVGVVRLLESIRAIDKNIKFYQASSSEMFGGSTLGLIRGDRWMDAESPFNPRSPYGVAKVMAHYATVNYRETYDMYACAGISFNHESSRRGHEFVTRKITDGVARIKAGLETQLSLGSLTPYRDWGFAGDYVEAMWLMLQQDEPRDYVLATGITHSVKEFAKAAFRHADLDYHQYVVTDPALVRPADVQYLSGCVTAARDYLGWEAKTDFDGLVKMMVDADLNSYGVGRAARDGTQGVKDCL